MRNLIIFALVALVVALFVGGPAVIEKTLHGWHRPAVESPDPAPTMLRPVVEPARPRQRSQRLASRKVDAVAEVPHVPQHVPAPTPQPEEDVDALDVERPTETATTNQTPPDLGALASGSALLMETIIDIAEMQVLATGEEGEP